MKHFWSTRGVETSEGEPDLSKRLDEYCQGADIAISSTGLRLARMEGEEYQYWGGGRRESNEQE